jgi:hypothetical protein
MKTLREIFDQPHKVQYTPNKNATLGSFYSNGKKYETEAVFHNWDNRSDVLFHHDGNLEIDHSQGMHAHKIISTVHHIIKKHMADYPNSDSISFSANNEEPSKVKLYRGMAKKFAHNHTEENMPDTDSKGKRTTSTMFTVHRKDFRK